MIVYMLEEIEVIKLLNEIIGWEIGVFVWYLICERKIDGEVVILDIDYLLKEIVFYLILV